MLQGSVRVARASLLAALMLAGCASYAPQPLASADIDAVLNSPDRAVLVRQAAALPQKMTLDFTRPLDGAALAAIAVLANPELRALRVQQRVADAQVFAAGLLPDPQLSLGFDHVLAPSGAGLVTGFAGGLTLDLLGAYATRGVARQVQRAAGEKVRLDIAWQEWSTAGQARLLAERLPRQQAFSGLARTAADVADRALARALTAAARGDIKADEVETRRIAAADANGRALKAEREAGATRLDLDALLGLRPGEPLTLAVPAPLPAWAAPDPEQLFVIARASRLDLQAFARGYDSAEAGLHRAVLGQYPRLAITLNRLRDTSAVHTFGPAITLDLPLWNRNRGEIAKAGAERERLKSEYAARLFRTRADIAALVAALNRDEGARAGLAAQLPELAAIAAHFEDAARRGDVSTPLAEAARASEIDKRLEWLALDQSCAEQRLALRLALGEPLALTPEALAGTKPAP